MEVVVAGSIGEKVTFTFFSPHGSVVVATKLVGVNGTATFLMK